MNLIIDIGNSYTKLAVFKQGKLTNKTIFNNTESLEKITDYLKTQSPFSNGIVSSVRKLDTNLFAVLKEQCDLLILNKDTPIPFKNLYSTPKTLGLDRIALVSAAANIFPEKNVLIIDAGTCITFDFINVHNQYLGGGISPGIRMRYNALNQHTAKLPLLKTAHPKQLIGDSTETSIHSGIINGVQNEITGIINEYKAHFSDLTVILTGGDANFLSKRLKSSIFANQNFLLEGLNFILEFNLNL